MDRTEAITHRHLYCPDIREDVQKLVSNCDIIQNTKGRNKRYSKLTVNLSEKMPKNTICLDLMDPFMM